MGQQDKNTVYNVIAFIFADRATGKQVNDTVKSTAWIQGYKVVADALVEVDEKGKAHIHQSGHGGIGATGGAVIGGLLGLIGGPVGLLAWAVAGGVIGGFAGHFAGRVIPKDDLTKLEAQMKPNTSAILAIIAAKDAQALIDSMTEYNAQVVTMTVGSEVCGEIAQAVAAGGTVPAGAAPAAAPAAPATPAAAATKQSA